MWCVYRFTLCKMCAIFILVVQPEGQGMSRPFVNVKDICCFLPKYIQQFITWQTSKLSNRIIIVLSSDICQICLSWRQFRIMKWALMRHTYTFKIKYFLILKYNIVVLRFQSTYVESIQASLILFISQDLLAVSQLKWEKAVK